MSGSSITSNRLLMVIAGTDTESSIEDQNNAVTAKFNLNLSPETINPTLH